ncbi:MAG: hypothetical protein IKM59_01490 [Oscillospiraceae bacterium]|nr:hypothetical protein [Oscillospiraceae bacterium]
MSEDLYRKMYARLCAGVSDAIDLLKEPNNTLCAMAYLQKILAEAEELYLTGDTCPSEDDQT